MNIFDTKFLAFFAANKLTVLLVFLLAGNVYQYIDSGKERQAYNAAIEKLHTIINERDARALDIERERSQRLEFLLSNLEKKE